MTDYTPIRVSFEVEEPTIQFEIEEPITVEFRVYYKKGKKWKKFLGEGYTGEPMANNLL